MYNGYNKIFWGIFIATFNIKLGMIKILPGFIGFMIILSGMGSLYRHTHIESFNRAKIFGIMTVIGTFIGFFLSIQAMRFSIFSQLLIVFYTVMEVIMFYKYIEGSIEYFNNNNYEEWANECIKKLRFYTVVSITNLILLNFTLMFNITYLHILVGIIFIVLRIYLMVMTYGFRNTFDKDLKKG